MSRFLGRVGMGFLVSIPITSLVTGSWGDAFALFLISIICTAGIGLVFWVPVWWGAGWLTLEVLFPLMQSALSNSDTPTTFAPAVDHPPSTNTDALDAYIRNAMAGGMETDEIKLRLWQNGWQEADIERAFENVVSSEPNTQET